MSAKTILMVGALGLVGGLGGGYYVAKRRQRALPAPTRGTVFWVRGKARLSGEEASILDAGALRTVRMASVAVEVLPDKKVVWDFGGVEVVLLERNGPTVPQSDPFGEESWLIEPYIKADPVRKTDAIRRQYQKAQIALTRQLLGLVALGILKNGGWYNSWPYQREDGSGWSEVPSYEQ